jgi:predicted ATP-grasp superfamily ATP-dependent carboligase
MTSLYDYSNTTSVSVRACAGRIPAVVVGGTGPGTLGMVRSLCQADIPVILLDEDACAPAMQSRYGDKIVISRTSGEPLVKSLLALAATLAGPAVLFVNSDEAVLTVSQFRAELANNYRFRLPSHACLTSLIHKTRAQRIAETHGFPVPRSVTIKHSDDLNQLANLSFPCIVKPTRATAGYVNGQFARAYKVSSAEEAEDACSRILPILPDLIVQEWIEGADSDLYFCLQYRGADGTTVSSFTGRKLSVWPRDVGVTASCTAAPHVRSLLQSLTEKFFEQVSFVGLGSIEFKRDARTGRILMIEPSVGRIDGQEEVATLHGANIPLAVYLYETGSPVPRTEVDPPQVIWRDSLSHWRSVRANGSRAAVNRKTKVYDAYWRLDDPIPAFFQFLSEAERSLRKAVRQVAFLHRWARYLRGRLRREQETSNLIG